MKYGYSIASALLFLCAAGAAQASGWGPNMNPGEGKRATIGCAARSTDESWACLVVRCDDDGSLALYADIAGGATALGGWTLGIDGAEWRVEGQPVEGLGFYTARLRGDVPDIVSALKQGSTMTFGPQLQMNAGYETISLRGSTREIARVERQCGLTGN